jgi:hypothetical protein
MTNLTEAQRELLLQATAAPDGAIDAPQDAKLTKPLIKQGLVIALPLAAGGGRLIITDAGSDAVGAPRLAATPSNPVDETVRAAGDESLAAPTPPGPKARTRVKTDGPSGKLGILADLLKRPDGATLEQMVVATGWQAHSVRGAMSGSLKKGFGLVIDSEKTETGRVYRIDLADAA